MGRTGLCCMRSPAVSDATWSLTPSAAGRRQPWGTPASLHSPCHPVPTRSLMRHQGMGEGRAAGEIVGSITMEGERVI